MMSSEDDSAVAMSSYSYLPASFLLGLHPNTAVVGFFHIQILILLTPWGALSLANFSAKFLSTFKCSANNKHVWKRFEPLRRGA